MSRPTTFTPALLLYCTRGSSGSWRSATKPVSLAERTCPNTLCDELDGVSALGLRGLSDKSAVEPFDVTAGTVVVVRSSPSSSIASSESDDNPNREDELIVPNSTLGSLSLVSAVNECASRASDNLGLKKFVKDVSN